MMGFSFFEEYMEMFLLMLQEHVQLFSVWAGSNGIPVNEQFLLTAASTMFFARDGIIF